MKIPAKAKEVISRVFNTLAGRKGAKATVTGYLTLVFAGVTGVAGFIGLASGSVGMLALAGVDWMFASTAATNSRAYGDEHDEKKGLKI